MQNHARLKPFAVALALAMLSAVVTTQARAETVSYSLMFCENLDVLKDPTNQTLMKNVAKHSQHVLMMQRTSPYFELRNTSESAALTQISLSIGDMAKNYDWANLVEASPGVGYTIQTVDGVMGGTKSDMLTISFTGLDPGDYVRFRFGISADDPNAPFIQDYRKTLFDLNGGDDITGNATVAVDFAKGDVLKQLTGQLPNYSMNGLTTAIDMSFPSGPCFDHVLPFTFDGSGTIDPPPGPPVPEPGSVVLLGCGIVGLVGLKLRSRRRR